MPKNQFVLPACIIAIAIVASAGLMIYFSAYQTCVRKLDPKDSTYDFGVSICAQITSGR